MDADNIVRLSPETIRRLLETRATGAQKKQPPGKRGRERWPFPGTVEVWLPEQCYGERHFLATLHNLSVGGLAMRTRRPVPTHSRLAFALHQPELSCYGEAIVRHCTQAAFGYLIGLEFIFDDNDSRDGANPAGA